MDLKLIAINLSCLSIINQNVGKTKKLFRELKNEFYCPGFWCHQTPGDWRFFNSIKAMHKLRNAG